MIYDETIYFTDRSWNILYGVIEEDYFQENEAGLIYEALAKKLRFIPFGDHLKRFIYRAAELTGPFREIDLDMQLFQCMTDHYTGDRYPDRVFSYRRPQVMRLAESLPHFLRLQDIAPVRLDFFYNLFFPILIHILNSHSVILAYH